MSNIIDKIQLSGITYTIGGQGGSGVSVVEVTQAEYDALPSSAKTDTSKMYVITDAQAGDLTNYYTKAETNTLLGGKADTATTYTKTEVDTALNGKADTATTYTKTEVDNAITAATATKQDTLVSGTNIKTINNQSLLGSGNIVIQGGGGGGKAVEAGRGISITTGETADTVSFNLPMSAGTGNNSILMSEGSIASGSKSMAGGQGCRATREGTIALGQISQATANWAVAIGNLCLASGKYSTAFGDTNKCYGEGNFVEGCNNKAGQDILNNQRGTHAEGYYTEAIGEGSHTEGRYTKTLNNGEHASGSYNVSNTGSTTADKTLFSVGNGTSTSARHNAFEIRQNGDIYYFDGTNDVKLQDKFSSIDTTIGDINTILQSI